MFPSHDRDNYINELKASSEDNKTMSGYKLLTDTTNAMAYEDIIRTFYNWENESDDLKLLLNATFGFYENFPDETILHDKIARFLVEFYRSDQPTLKDNITILDRYYKSLIEEFKRIKNN